jgi:hypothetical protein
MLNTLKKNLYSIFQEKKIYLYLKQKRYKLARSKLNTKVERRKKCTLEPLSCSLSDVSPLLQLASAALPEITVPWSIQNSPWLPLGAFPRFRGSNGN